MHVEKEVCQNLDRASRLEWLETNGRGGFASGTVAGANTRRYHALLLVAKRPPVERSVLVNHLEEWVETGSDTFPLSTNIYGGVVHPDGYRRCLRFSSDPWPTWSYQEGDLSLQRELFCSWGRDLVVVRWSLTDGPARGVTLRVRPMLSGRDYHATHHENAAVLVQAWIGERQVTWQPYSGLPPVHAFHNGQYRHTPDWYRRLHLPAERERGLDDQEDWWSPGEIAYQLLPGECAELVLTTEPRDGTDVSDLEKDELARRKQLTASAPRRNHLAKSLWRAAPAYLSVRGDRHTIVAGYPWFTDWGRDSFISLPGLCLVSGWHELAWQVIDAFAAHVSEGMVPNRFPDAGEQPEYNAIDASLWFVHAVDRYLSHGGDDAQVKERVWPAIKQILDGYRRGTRYGIRQDEDGLITGGAPGAQLTWMDVKIGDRPVTPRHGKPVEIQALWVRALAIGEQLAARCGEAEYASVCRKDRDRAIRAFRDRFWCEPSGYLYDVVDGPEGDDATLRPNQLYAIAFDDGLVSKEQANRILDVIRTRLLTPVGVRTLAADDPRYRPRYEGGVSDRDSAYHQGTVWPFLLGSFVTAWIKTKGRSPQAKKQAREFLQGLERHLDEACLGHVSEIFDAEPPHAPRGCPGQAWSVAEPLRALIEDLGVSLPKGQARTTARRSAKRTPRSASPHRNKTGNP
jgi:predicted glycogen debranching enzyme